VGKALGGFIQDSYIAFQCLAFRYACHLSFDPTGKTRYADGQVFIMVPQSGHLKFEFPMQGL